MSLSKNTRVRVFFVFLVMLTRTPEVLFAQIAENPLYETITVTAEVPQSPTNIPPQPTNPPQPFNPVDMKDVAIFKGMAYPGSTIGLIKNGTLIAEIPASPNGTFELRVRNLDPGTYSFGVRAQDSDSVTSKLLSFTIFVTAGVTTVIDGIFIPPTITSDKVEVKKGEVITFMGYSSPDAAVRLSFHSDAEILKKAKASGKGYWIYKMDSSELELGDHNAKARSITEDDLSPYGDTLPFRVGDTNRMRTKQKPLFGFRTKCDLNGDSRVNILDFSIMAFWYKRFSFPGKVDLNQDNQVNLTDVSILAFCWTG